MNFGQALEYLKQGRRVSRLGWNGKGMWLELIKGNEYKMFYQTSYEALPFIGMKTADNKFVPWLASQTDLLAEDYIVLPEEERCFIL